MSRRTSSPTGRPISSARASRGHWSSWARTTTPPAAGQGADDNASGVGVMLEVAERLAHYKIDYDVVFVAFGAEEAGLQGLRLLRLAQMSRPTWPGASP